MEQVLLAVQSVNTVGGGEESRRAALKFLERFQNTVKILYYFLGKYFIYFRRKPGMYRWPS